MAVGYAADSYQLKHENASCKKLSAWKLQLTYNIRNDTIAPWTKIEM